MKEAFFQDSLEVVDNNEIDDDNSRSDNNNETDLEVEINVEGDTRGAKEDQSEEHVLFVDFPTGPQAGSFDAREISISSCLFNDH